MPAMQVSCDWGTPGKTTRSNMGTTQVLSCISRWISHKYALQRVSNMPWSFFKINGSLSLPQRVTAGKILPDTMSPSEGLKPISSDRSSRLIWCFCKAPLFTHRVHVAICWENRTDEILNLSLAKLSETLGVLQPGFTPPGSTSSCSVTGLPRDPGILYQTLDSTCYQQTGPKS